MPPQSFTINFTPSTNFVNFNSYNFESDSDEIDFTKSNSDETHSDKNDYDETDSDETDFDEVDSDEIDVDEIDSDETDSNETNSNETDSDDAHFDEADSGDFFFELFSSTQLRSPTLTSFIDSLPSVKSFESSNNCPICMEEFGINSEASQLPCKHFFHNDCIFPWLINNNTYPLCRHKLPLEDEEEIENHL
ncbi:hypothetical protein RDI58_000761 [Solanum bulbocastanum]|uniref:RING-type E3 ubiquitin transferase n=1 Tax=Solanum bulbocastanum TaxID=147425 RepID=A0AAN8UCR8_SOLBU